MVGLSIVCRQGRLLVGGRHDCHGHECQCVCLDHSRPTKSGSGHDFWRKVRCHVLGHSRQARQATQRAQHLFHAACDFCHAKQPLQFLVHASTALAYFVCHDVCGCLDSPVLCATAWLPFRPRSQPLAFCGSGCRFDRCCHCGHGTLGRKECCQE